MLCAARPVPCLLDAASSTRDAARSATAQAPRTVESCAHVQHARGTARAPHASPCKGRGRARARGSGQDLGSQRRLHARVLLFDRLHALRHGHDFERRRARPAAPHPTRAVSPAPAPARPRQTREPRAQRARARRAHAYRRSATAAPSSLARARVCGEKPCRLLAVLSASHSASCCARLFLIGGSILRRRLARAPPRRRTCSCARGLRSDALRRRRTPPPPQAALLRASECDWRKSAEKMRFFLFVFVCHEAFR